MTSKVNYPDYAKDLEQLTQFLQTYVDDDDTGPAKGNPKYLTQLQQIADHETTVLTIHLDDVRKFLNEEFVSTFARNTLRYLQLLYKVADGLMPTPSAPLTRVEPHDVWLSHRQQRFAALYNNQTTDNTASNSQVQSQQSQQPGENATSQSVPDLFPPELTRRYEIQIEPFSLAKPRPLRDVRANDVGALVTIRGIVTRVTDVAPLVRVVTYVCNECGWETYQPINDRSFTPLTKCPSRTCETNRSKGNLRLQTRGSKFVRFQSVRLQELHTEVPIGSVPRTLHLRTYGALTRQCKPGDQITVTGIFLPVPHTGFRAIRGGLTADTYLEVMHIKPAKRSYTEMDLEQPLLEEIEQKSNDIDIYEQLAQSIAPEIYGHQDIKKALLLLLTAGVSKTLSDGVKIRGDINVLLMGDPGVAKSQLLKHIAHVAPRGVYTTGKGSSGVGLTASVVRDPITGDMMLEGGSLVLADMGICCIDEFDKMDEGDRTAIHEVMEQQTVSIAKAGITTTLNARTSVLAAANPVFGRWRPTMSLESNLGLPTSLLSRFDLSFIVLDLANIERDMNLAQHVTYVHMNGAHPPLRHATFSPQFLRSYISVSRQYAPTVPSSLMDTIVSQYIGLRKENEQPRGRVSKDPRINNRQRFCTPRTLLSILRLSQASARVHMRSVVSRADVDEAIRLIHISKHSQDEDEDDGNRTRRDASGEIYSMINSARAARGTNVVYRKDVYPQVLARGYTREQLDSCLEEYERLNVWMVNQTTIRFIVQMEEFDGTENPEEEEI